MSRVFVATDAEGAVEQLRELAPELTWLTLTSYDRQRLQSGDHVWLENRLQGGEVSGHDLMLFTLRDLALLAHADVFVGLHHPCNPHPLYPSNPHPLLRPLSPRGCVMGRVCEAVVRWTACLVTLEEIDRISLWRRWTVCDMHRMSPHSRSNRMSHVSSL